MPLVNIFSIAYQEKFTKYGAHREKLWYSPSSIDTYFDDTLELDHINDDIMWDDAIWVLLTSSTYNYQKSPFIMDLIKRYKKVEFKTCDDVRGKLTFLCDGITHLTFHINAEDFKNELDTLPDTLEELNIYMYDECNETTLYSKLEKLPRGLKKLYIKCSNITSDLYNLPSGLEKLYLGLHNANEYLDYLPIGLKTLCLNNVYRKLEQLPHGLDKLEIINLYDFDYISCLPPTLKTLIIFHHRGDKFSTNILPDSLEYLYFPLNNLEMRLLDIIKCEKKLTKLKQFRIKLAYGYCTKYSVDSIAEFKRGFETVYDNGILVFDI